MSESRPGSWRRRVRRSLVAVGGLVVIVAALELSLWLAAAIAAEALAGGREAGRDGFTIVCVGDSWTQGARYGTYPDLLVDRLNSRVQGGPVRAINLGLAGTNSSQAVRRLAATLPDVRADLIVVLTGNNDHWNLKSSAYWRFADRELGGASILAARLRIFLHSLRSYRLARVAWRRMTGRATANEFFYLDPEGDLAARSELIAVDRVTHDRQLEYNLTRLVELARARGIPVVFMTYFHFHGYGVNEVIRDVAATHGIPLVDHNYNFHTRIAEQQRGRYRIADGHPSRAGYQFMTAGILEILDQHELAPGPLRSASLPTER